jgi:hypothetical protein
VSLAFAFVVEKIGIAEIAAVRGKPNIRDDVPRNYDLCNPVDSIPFFY